MLIGRWTKLITTSNEISDMNQGGPAFDENSCRSHNDVLWDSRYQE